MWAQLIDFRLKAGRDEALEETLGILADGEQPGSGLVRQSVLRDQLDPARVVIVVMFDSEERARQRENDPRRADSLAQLRERMSDAVDGVPTFTNLTVHSELAY